MGQTGDVVKDCVRGHFDDAFAFGPVQILGRLMIKDICYKYTFLAVTDRAGHPAVVAVDATAKIVCELFEV